MKFKIFLILSIITIGALAYFGYPIVKERYFKNANQASQESDTAKNNTGKANYEIKNQSTGNQNETNAGENSASNDSAANDAAKTETDEGGISANITSDDCDNECANFKNNASDLKYCQNICDISPIKDSANCGEKQGSDKDYCFKNQAIEKTDLNICDSISDSKIKSSCKNRVTENMLENQL
jgi:hypothetical protein